MPQYREIESGQSIIDAIEFLLKNDLPPEIETHCVLNNGVHTTYTWCLTEPGGDVTLNYMDEDYVFPRSTFEETWNETYANGMFLPPLDASGDELTVLGDGSSCIVGVGATVYKVDSRYLEGIYEGKSIDDIDALPVLAEATHSLEDLVDSTGDFHSSELLAIFEFARIALADANIYDKLARDTDMTDEDMKSIQGKLQRHLNMSSGESEEHDIELGMG